MHIYLTCICEKRLKIPARLGGRKVRCKYCDRILLVPDAQAIAAADEAAGASAKAQAAKVDSAQPHQDAPPAQPVAAKTKPAVEKAQAAAAPIEPATPPAQPAAPPADLVQAKSQPKDYVPERPTPSRRKAAKEDETFEGVDDDEDAALGEDAFVGGMPDFLYTRCSNCRKRVKGPIQKAGKRGKCPQCGDEVYLPWVPASRTQPDPEDEMLTSSGFQELPADQSHAGAEISGMANFQDEHAAPTGNELKEAQIPKTARPATADEVEVFGIDDGGSEPIADRPRLKIRPRRELDKKTLIKPLLGVLSVAMMVSAAAVWGGRAASGVATSERKAWYWDLGSNKIFEASDQLVAPIDAPSGALRDGTKAGVRAYVFACGSCAEVKNHFVGYFEKYTPEAQIALAALAKGQKATTDGNDPLAQGLLVATPSERQWVPLSTPEGAQILGALQARCNDEELMLCSPGQ